MSVLVVARRGLDGPWSLADRLTIHYGLSAFLLVVVATGVLDWTLARALDHETGVRLSEAVHVVQKVLRERPDDAAALRLEVERAWSESGPVALFVRIEDARGGLVLETPSMTQRLAGRPAVQPDGAGAHFVAAGRRFRLAAARAKGDRVVIAALDVTDEDVLLSRFRERAVLVLTVALVICLLTARWLTRTGLQPLATMADASRGIDPHRLSDRIALPGLPQELLALGDALNTALARLEDAFGRMSRFSHDIAHELRTPLHNLKTGAEVALARPRDANEYRDVLVSSLDECDRLARLIDRLLFLARADASQAPPEREQVDVRELVTTVADYYGAQSEEASVALSTRLPDRPVTCVLDRSLVRSAIANLVENALRYTPAGGQILLSTSASESGVTTIEVRDTGEGIPAEHVPHVFDRFYRVDPARTGGGRNVGLGLAIVRSVMTLHRGQARCESQVGQGTTITLTFPSSVTAPGTSSRPSAG